MIIRKMLKDNEKIYKTMNVIRSRKHEIYSETINKKVALHLH